MRDNQQFLAVHLQSNGVLVLQPADSWPTEVIRWLTSHKLVLVFNDPLGAYPSASRMIDDVFQYRRYDRLVTAVAYDSWWADPDDGSVFDPIRSHLAMLDTNTPRNRVVGVGVSFHPKGDKR